MNYIYKTNKDIFLPIMGKVDAIIADGGKVIKTTILRKNLICVLGNTGVSESALIVSDEKMFNELMKDDGRKKTFMIYETT